MSTSLFLEQCQNRNAGHIESHNSLDKTLRHTKERSGLGVQAGAVPDTCQPVAETWTDSLMESQKETKYLVEAGYVSCITVKSGGTKGQHTAMKQLQPKSAVHSGGSSCVVCGAWKSHQKHTVYNAYRSQKQPLGDSPAGETGNTCVAPDYCCSIITAGLCLSLLARPSQEVGRSTPDAHRVLAPRWTREDACLSRWLEPNGMGHSCRRLATGTEESRQEFFSGRTASDRSVERIPSAPFVYLLVC
ncbi:hypothetical protein CEXT_256471 [Caerostris extrusa]|uniref:Uncharacterized protein n=1 Tax=Caerostris extrusa TaxID=172846 RepID=A0AAV4W539_CAEEX|nr:hypothetical protein CEXT_256471 [Caerostris extrusa]